jgi:hypothetical protein
VSQLVNFSQPDYFSMDIESFPELEAWLEVGFHSANYKKLPGESDSEAVRDFGLAFAPSLVRGYVSAVRQCGWLTLGQLCWVLRHGDVVTVCQGLRIARSWLGGTVQAASASQARFHFACRQLVFHSEGF